jgi:hypothetical protein
METQLRTGEVDRCSALKDLLQSSKPIGLE